MDVAAALRGWLSLLGAWGTFTTSQAFTAHARRADRRWQLLAVDALFTGSSFLCAAALGLGWFRAWMLAPFGLSYLLMIPVPCYFKAVNRSRGVHLARNLLFVLVALLSFALALRALPLAWFGV
ncbi:hypothetical protein [Mycobacterium shinjukuense]|uniref:hypothetical protein n=1 Tax=Mycobacterium shinjukuense TaxID=398694 RepID=UPI003100D7A7